MRDWLIMGCKAKKIINAAQSFGVPFHSHPLSVAPCHPSYPVAAIIILSAEIIMGALRQIINGRKLAPRDKKLNLLNVGWIERRETER